MGKKTRFHRSHFMAVLYSKLLKTLRRIRAYGPHERIPTLLTQKGRKVGLSLASQGHFSSSL